MWRLKDKEGVCFEDQLVSCNKAQDTRERDAHKDENIDIRNFIQVDSEDYE